MLKISQNPINTGHKTFDKKANNDLLITGNVVGNCQFSSYIRAYNQTECNEKEFKPGALQSFDLRNFFVSGYHVPYSIEYRIESDKNQRFILYCIRHSVGSKKRIHGWILTDDRYKLLSTARCGGKSRQVIEGVLPYITE